MYSTTKQSPISHHPRYDEEQQKVVMVAGNNFSDVIKRALTEQGSRCGRKSITFSSPNVSVNDIETFATKSLISLGITCSISNDRENIVGKG